MPPVYREGGGGAEGRDGAAAAQRVFLAVRAPHVRQVSGPASFRAPVALLEGVEFFPRGAVHAAQAAYAVVMEASAAERHEIRAPRANRIYFIFKAECSTY